MSLEQVSQFTETLPFRMREDVLGYARSVQDALGDIFREAGIKPDPALGNQLVFLAGVKKLHAICTGTFWILDNSLASLEHAGAYQVRVGSLRISRTSKEYKQLRRKAREPTIGTRGDGRGRIALPVRRLGHVNQIAGQWQHFYSKNEHSWAPVEILIRNRRKSLLTVTVPWFAVTVIGVGISAAVHAQ